MSGNPIGSFPEPPAAAECWRPVLETYLLPIRASALIFPALAFVMLVPVAVVLYRRHGVMRWSALSFYTFAYYGIATCCLVIMPLPSGSVDVCTKYAKMREPQLIPGSTFGDVWKEADHQFTLSALILTNPAVYKTVFNIALIVPLGMFLRYLLRWGLLPTTLAGLGTSLLFEISQYTGLFGIYPCPYRLADVDDLIVNTSGAVIGWLLAGPIVRRLSHPRYFDDRVLARHPVPFGRRVVALLLDWTGCLACAVVAAFPAYWMSVDFRLMSGAAAVVFLAWFVGLPRLTGTTPGKWLLLLRLTTADGKRPTAGKLLLRALLMALPVVPPMAMYGGGALVLLVNLVSEADVWRGIVAQIQQNPAYVQQQVFDTFDGRTLVRCLVLAVPVVFIHIGLVVYAVVVRRNPQDRSVHELASGVSNSALPHTRAARESVPEAGAVEYATSAGK